MSRSSTPRKATAPAAPAAPAETEQTSEPDTQTAPEPPAEPTPAEPTDTAPLAPPTTPPPAAPPVASTAAPQPAAAPLAPPAAPNTAPAAPLVAPMPVAPADVDAFLGYVDDAGEPIDPDDLFDMGGVGTIVTVKRRANALIRRGNSKTTLMSLAFPAGMEVTRSTAQEAIAKARAAAEQG